MKRGFFLRYVSLLMVLSSVFIACDKDDDNPNPNIRKEWIISLSTKYQVPAVVGRSETGQVKLTLFNNDTLQYELIVQNLSVGDLLSLAHFHVGDVVTNGSVIVDFNPSFIEGMASGNVLLRPSFRDSLLDPSKQIYFNVHSQQFPNGLVRGQVNTNIALAADLALSAANEVPPVTTTATAFATLRVTGENKLYSIVTVNTLEAADALTVAHIHQGAAGVNGNPLIFLCHTASDFGTTKIANISVNDIYILQTQPVYVNVHSVLHPNGIVRGQVQF